jgi:hypothetical protein
MLKRDFALLITCRHVHSLTMVDAVTVGILTRGRLALAIF